MEYYDRYREGMEEPINGVVHGMVCVDLERGKLFIGNDPIKGRGYHFSWSKFINAWIECDNTIILFEQISEAFLKTPKKRKRKHFLRLLEGQKTLSDMR